MRWADACAPAPAPRTPEITVVLDVTFDRGRLTELTPFTRAARSTSDLSQTLARPDQETDRMVFNPLTLGSLNRLSRILLYLEECVRSDIDRLIVRFA